MIAQGFNNLIMNTANVPGQVLVGGKAKPAGGPENSFQALFSNMMSGMSKKVSKSETLGMKNLMALMNVNSIKGKPAKTVAVALAGAIKQENGEIPQGRFVSTDGIDALKGLLLSAGFKQDKVEGFIKDIKQTSDNKDIPLPKILSKLGTFIKENDSAENTDMSSLSCLQSLLSGLGLNQSQVKHIMTKAFEDGNEINLDALVSEFKFMAPENGKAASIDTTLSSNGLNSLPDGQDKGKTTLDQFAARLESLKTNLKPVDKADMSIAGSESNANPIETFAGIFGGNIRNGIKSVMSDTVPATMKTVTDGTQSLNLHFDSKLIKNQSNTDNNNNTSWMDNPGTGKGKNRNSLMEQTGMKMKSIESDMKPDMNTIKETSGTFGKVMKEAVVSVKESSDSGSVTTRHFTVSDIIGKITDVKTAVASPETPVSDKTLPSYVTDQVVRQISKAVKTGDTEIRFQIRPPEMGKVQLSIETTKEGIKVNIMAENNTARDLLLNQASELKTILSDQGIRLERINVGLAGDFGHSMAQTRQDGEQSGKGRRDRDKSSFQVENISELGGSDKILDTIRNIKGNLDLVA